MVKEFIPEVRNSYYDSIFSDKETDLEKLTFPQKYNLLCTTVQNWIWVIRNLRACNHEQDSVLSSPYIENRRGNKEINCLVWHGNFA